MKFLVDAQLPRRLAVWLTQAGYDVTHTSQLPKANKTPDDEICQIADREGRVVVTKDDDFVYSHLAANSPALLLLVSTGNIDNQRLLSLFESKIQQINQAFQDSRFVELAWGRIILHG